jgi:hypothetical protein
MKSNRYLLGVSLSIPVLNGLQPISQQTHFLGSHKLKKRHVIAEQFLVKILHLFRVSKRPRTLSQLKHFKTLLVDFIFLFGQILRIYSIDTCLLL